jgi:hypothetical protein
MRIGEFSEIAISKICHGRAGDTVQQNPAPSWVPAVGAEHRSAVTPA